ncbi:nucleoside permease [Gilliamella sp. wkB171]|uniref:nucleoside permease n=1 Tax=Gilliamella sp. wkB171 TaxID=3120258 RepID=UPI000813CCAD|nr:nucleoside permease [Gilliamella apicola]OCL29749.1 nucleoside transporter [Gilliamella apicola]
MNMNNIKLSSMMFLEWFIWGAWFVPLWQFLSYHGFSAAQISLCYATTAMAAVISPIIIGSITDRYFAAQKVLAVLCILGALLMYLAAQQTTFNLFFPILFLYALTYMPTVALTNTIALSNVSDAERYFPRIRVLGTIGWIASGVVCGFLPTLLGFGDISKSNIPLIITAISSVVLGIFAFMLPNTPPKSTGKISLRVILGLDAIILLKDREFRTFTLCSFLFCIPLAFYYTFSNGYLTEIGMTNATGWLSLGQVSEILFMLCLPLFIKRYGIKNVLMLGLITAGIRYGLFVYGGVDNLFIYSLLFIGILLHGVSYDFYFVTGYVYVDKKAPAHVRASAQGLFSLFCLGLGNLVGYNLGGTMMEYFFKYETPENGVTYNWAGMWGFGAVMIVIIAVIFLLFFREKREIEPIKVDQLQ